MNKFLLIASGHSANKYFDYPYKEKGWTVCTVNNAYRLMDEWDYALTAPDIYGEIKRMPIKGKLIRVHGPEVLEEYGGIDKAGRGILICSTYYVWTHFKPDIIAYLGADMNYTPNEKGYTAFYGLGTDMKKRKISDPDRIIKHFEGGDEEYFTKKFLDFQIMAGIQMYNFSDDPETRLPFTQINPEDIDE